jgi:hypothetical protein
LQGNVIGTAPLARQLHQSGTAFGRGIAVDCGYKFLIGHHAPQAIGTKQEIVAILQGQSLFGAVDRHIYPSA